MRFVDTNVLLYAISKAPEEATRAERALQILEAPDCAMSVQVLQEFYVKSTRSSRAERIDHQQAVSLIESWCRFPVQELTVAILNAALSCKDRYQIGYWDAAIVEAARAAGCREVLSEDLQDGEDFGGVRVVNPFRGV